MKILRFRSTFSRPADATQYAAGDEVSSNATAGSVVRAVFNMTGFTRGRIVQAALDITPAAAGNFVITAADFELQIFKTPDAPAAVGDNVTHPILAATQCLAIGHWRFDDGAWLNPLGALTSSGSAYQQTLAQSANPLATPALQAPLYPGQPFTFEGQTAAQREFTAVLRTLAAWNPTGVVNAFGITLDIEAE